MTSPLNLWGKANESSILGIWDVFPDTLSLFSNWHRCSLHFCLSCIICTLYTCPPMLFSPIVRIQHKKMCWLMEKASFKGLWPVWAEGSSQVRTRWHLRLCGIPLLSRSPSRGLGWRFPCQCPVSTTKPTILVGFQAIQASLTAKLDPWTPVLCRYVTLNPFCTETA